MSKSIHYSKWLPQYMKGLFILSRTYDPSTEYVKTAMKCFIESLATVLPDKNFCKIFQDFIDMNVYVCNFLITNPSLRNFFSIYKDFSFQLENYPQNFFNFCLQSEFTLFTWVYLLNSYITILFNKSGHNITIESFNDVRNRRYNPQYLTKEDWGNSIWLMIHLTPLYSPGTPIEVYNNLKAMLSCLRFILPCQKCQMHLSENLADIDIDSCATSREQLFECTWRLHNIVNKSLDKRQPSLQEARALYNF